MNLPDIFRSLLERYGKELIADEKLVNFLADYNAFKARGTRMVAKLFVERGLGREVLELDSRPADERPPRMRSFAILLAQEGLKELNVSYFLESVSYAMGWHDEEPQEVAGAYKPHIHTPHYSVYVKDLQFDMRMIEGGEFSIGATPEQLRYAAFDEKPAVNVFMSAFYLAETLVTQDLYEAVMNENPSHHKGARLPVERVSFEDCEDFIAELYEQTGIKFRLPTEAEWEYAARGGPYAANMKNAGAYDDDLADHAWFKDNSEGRSHEVATKLPNCLGLYDMSGNVGEWCSDWYFNSYSLSAMKVDPRGPEFGSARVFRGGSWNDTRINCRLSKRFSMNPAYRNKLVGFRLAASKLYSWP